MLCIMQRTHPMLKNTATASSLKPKENIRNNTPKDRLTCVRRRANQYLQYQEPNTPLEMKIRFVSPRHSKGCSFIYIHDRGKNRHGQYMAHKNPIIRHTTTMICPAGRSHNVA